jgi:hypothetical protein
MSQFIEHEETGLFDEFLGEIDAGVNETALTSVGKITKWSLF